MINRSKIKYSLQRILPKALFRLVLKLWQKIFVNIINILDTFRLRKFKTYQSIKTSHAGHDFSLFISPQNGFIDKHIFLYGTYEPHILDVIATYLKPGGIFVDVGANIGQHSMFAASIVGNKGRVYSFEPIPYIYKQLIESVKINHFESIIEAYPFALGSENKTESLYVETNNVGGSSIVGPHGDANKKIEVEIKRGDDTLALLPKIMLVKIDVEGYEFEVLSGMEKTLRQHLPVIVLEFSGQLYLQKGNNEGDKIISLLQSIGYDLYDIEDYMKKIVSKMVFLNEFNSSKAQCDLLCTPRLQRALRVNP